MQQCCIQQCRQQRPVLAKLRTASAMFAVVTLHSAVPQNAMRLGGCQMLHRKVISG
eukprot:CAMPEP_0119305510 /NCGR_PEP_ID=MMETSP1333-20130426/6500_1 /TAXON_ID=418940 /ORGANISM="Scyphosphaera apsteinii, Strain RCC1455" /LENGTH=55 /DNA_ID=CAMNT_0007308625 /DNA_START=699 /DNA_END=866 /DNA_ORIENTATION=-